MKKRNIPSTGIIYFYIHFVTETVCFFVLGRFNEAAPVMWFIPLAYDMLAFVPQSLAGYINDKFLKWSPAYPGFVLLAVSLLLQGRVNSYFAVLLPLCIGNALIHVNGAEVTLRTSGGRLSHSAIFVSGGSFGVITGRLLSNTAVPSWVLLALILSAVPFVFLAKMYLNESSCGSTGFSFCNTIISPAAVVILAVFTVAVRGYMGYGIPTSWNKTTLQTVLLYTAMGIGKAAGGILSDRIGLRKTALISIIGALPFLLFGDKIMIVSLLGVMMFSMTMAVTLGLLVSVFPDNPGLAFGFTTTGLFLGALPVAFVKINSFTVNCIMLTVLSVVCAASMMCITGREDADG